MIRKDVMHAAAIILLSFAGHTADDKDSKPEVRKATTETKKVGQANVDVGDINFDGKFGAGPSKKNKNKGGRNHSESK